MKNNAQANLNQSRTARDNASQLQQLGNMLTKLVTRNAPGRTQTPSLGLTLGNRSAARA